MLKTFCRWLAPGLLSAIPLLAAAMGNPQPGLGVGLAAGADGQLYAALVRDGHLQILRSNDLGQHWQAHSQVNSQAEAIADDAENAPQLSVSAQGALYVSWSRRFAERFTGDIRFARAENGRDFSAPRTVHRDQRLTGHSFVRQHLDRNGRLWLVWIDGRERLDNPAYQGSALYASHSDDGGRQFVAEYKLVDHSCQCCRLALTERADGSLLLFWRQLFEQGQRDHALLPLGRERPGELRRATFDGWQVDACPHHGPALAEDSQGRLHALWFSPHGEQGPLFYGQLADGQVLGQRSLGGPRAGHGAVASLGQRVVLLWKEFDGQRTQLLAEISEDGGEHFRRVPLASSQGPSDHPRLLRVGNQLLPVWHSTDHGLKGYPLP